MKFEIKEWRKIYDRVQFLGKKLKDSQFTFNENKKPIMPISPLGEEEQFKIKKDIQLLLEKNKRYLDDCGMKPKDPLWIYCSREPKTWMSHHSFKYSHLIKYEEKLINEI